MQQTANAAADGDRYAYDIDGDVMTRADSIDWLRNTCPTMFCLLKSKAKTQLPCGLQHYIGSGSGREEVGRQKTETVERALNVLIRKCGKQRVAHAYRRDISGIDKNRIKALFSEICMCAFLAERFDRTELHPKTNKRTFSDCRVEFDDIDVWCEIKRYEDQWPPLKDESKEKSDDLHFSARSLSMTPTNAIPTHSERPRFMDLRSKLVLRPISL